MGKKLEIFLAKVYQIGQSAPTLTGADFQQVADAENSLEIVTAKSDINYIKGGLGQDEKIRSSVNVNASLSYHMNIASGIPQWAEMFKAACHSVTDDGDTITIAPILEPENCAAVSHYTGTKKTGKAFITKGEKIQFSPKISANAREIPVVTFGSGMGIFAGHETGTQPSITKAELEKYTSIFNPTVSLHGNEYKLLSFEMDMANTLQQELDADSEYGFGDADVEDRVTRITMSVYAKADSVNPHTALLADTVGALEVVWGKAGQQLTIDANVQINEAPMEQEGAFYKWNLVLDVIDDDYTITADKIAATTTTTTTTTTTQP